MGLHMREKPLFSAAMFCTNPLRAVFLIGALLFSALAHANEASGKVIAVPEQTVTFIDRASANVQDALEQALDLIGIRYKRGGSSPETGFDCSGFVAHVFKEGLGLYLPRSSREISKAGEVVRYCDNNRAKWSESGNGWVVPRDVAVNAAAWAEYAGLMVVTTKPRRAGAA